MTLSGLEIQEILQHLPHRYPFLLIDRVLQLDPDKRIVALKNVSINEPFFQGHFPGNPVMPGVLLIEALAQAAGILSFKSMGVKPNQGSVLLFAGIDHARFKKPVMPGDQLTLYVETVRVVRGIGKYACRAEVAGGIVAEAEILAALRV